MSERVKTDLFLEDLTRKRLRRHRFWYVGAFGLLLLSLTVQQPLFFLAALLALVPAWWYRHALRYLVVQQQVRQPRVFYAQETIFAVILENQKWFPLLWLSCEVQVRPRVPVLTGQPAQRETIGQIDVSGMLWSFQRVTRRYRLRCVARGLYVFGPLILSSSDPFGWMQRQAVLPVQDILLVYPLIVPVEALGLPLSSLFGSGATQRRLFEDPLRVMGVRGYQVGDDPRRIHWKATARTGVLQSKIYEYQNQQCVLVLLDTGDEAAALMQVSREMQEFAISVAASLVVSALDDGYKVGALMNCALLSAPEPVNAHVQEKQREPVRSRQLTVGKPGVSVPFTHKRGHAEELLATFARLAPATSGSMELLMAREDALFMPGLSVIFVSVAETLSTPMVKRLWHIRKRGCRLQVLLTNEPGSEEAPAMSALAVHHLGGAKKWHALAQSAGAEEKEQAGGTKSVQLQLD